MLTRKEKSDRMKIWYMENSEYKKAYQKNYYQNNKEKSQAKGGVRYALKIGLLTKPRWCEVCGNDHADEAHHYSYAKADHLQVIWACKQCHAQLDKQRRSDDLLDVVSVVQDATKRLNKLIDRIQESNE